MRALARIGLVFLIVAFAFSAVAKKKKKEQPLRSNPGGASQKWACAQIAENACDIAKRCEPDRSLRHCKKLRDRCANVKDRTSRTATEDDVSVCGHSVADLSCKAVTFDNTNGVNFDMKKLETCAAVAQDNPLPPAGKASPEDDADDDKKKQSDDDDQ